MQNGVDEMQLKIVIFLISLIFFFSLYGEEKKENPLNLYMKKKEEKKEENTKTYQLEGTVVETVREKKPETASTYKLNMDNFHIIPRKNAAEQLMLAPGILVVNHGGSGHATSTYMRGFAAKEGQDIAFSIDGVPLNEISNPHGHGYTDLHFIIPELVNKIDVKEGPFDLSQGDFGFAGSADYQLGVKERGTTVTYGRGLWNTERALLVIAPENQDSDTFAGFEFNKSDGFGENRASIKASGNARYSGGIKEDGFTWKLSAYGYTSRYDQAGVIREDDYKYEKIGFYDTYDSNQGGESSRILLSFSSLSGSDRAYFDQNVYLGFRTMNLRANFTGYKNDVDEYGVYRDYQRGDDTEMRYTVFTGGLKGEYTYAQIAEDKIKLKTGYNVRLDHGETSQYKLTATLGNPYAEVFDDTFTVINISGWAGSEVNFLKRFKLEGGLRIDSFSFNVTKKSESEDLLNTTSSEPDQTVKAYGYTLNPRVRAGINIVKGLTLTASYGHATRSVDAMSLSDNEAAPFSRSHQFETGLLYNYKEKKSFISSKTQFSYLFANIDKDITFSADSGRTVVVGPSTRHAILFNNETSLGKFLTFLTNAGYTYGTWDTTITDEHEKGDLIENVPKFIFREDIVLKGKLGNLAIKTVPVTGKFGLGFTYMPGMPLKYKETGTPYYLLNCGGSIRLWYFTLGTEMRNLLNQKYHAMEYNYASNFEGPETIASKIPEKHFVAGEPFYIGFSLTFHVEEFIRKGL